MSKFSDSAILPQCMFSVLSVEVSGSQSVDLTGVDSLMQQHDEHEQFCIWVFLIDSP